MLFPRGMHYERYFLALNLMRVYGCSFSRACAELFEPGEDLTLEMPGLTVGERQLHKKRYHELVAQVRRDNDASL